MSAVPIRFDAHPYNVGMVAGATNSGQKLEMERLQFIPSCKSNSYESFIHLALQVHHTFILLHLTSFIIPKSLLHFLPDYLISTSITFDPLVLSKLCLPLSKKTWSATSLYVMYPTPLVQDNDIHKGSYTT
uniref:Uncharacterized protein n=1 Tax=Quercus lobata TaxID=97700 RepID=A0A7N2LKK3_QUELO